ncbi:MAG: flagellar hook-basal body protein [Clostridiales bacterium]|jgi:flagellar basal-body rod protein FlgG|nr:flagellar hook-basal body protein [Eubacteriales bacterium]MDH7567023.1 flagellar hook-basal body protein [Clostridiales bacterium]
MMRALWTAGSGMTAQQFNVDVISNNLANVNTTGYKKERAEFKDLLYETLERAYMLNGDGKPVNLQVGLGTAVGATVKNFSPGSYEKTDNPLDFAIDGEGFFTVRGPAGNVVYTRDGSFKVSVTDEGKKLTTSDGYPVLDDQGNEILVDVEISRLNVSPEGDLSYVDTDGNAVPLGQRIGLVKFPNRYALESIGNNFFVENSATGAAVPDGEQGVKSTIKQCFLESSNVQVVEEMVKMIVAQRAYEVNSKAIQSADEMLQMANNLRR